ncbi:MAG: preprotein translocase subunit SecA [Phycisphaeraceae bacterium]|nr:preprotein translocase subunit SecA [Phycisphaeraceae bacterium]
MVIQYISRPFTKVFGSRNDRLIKAYRRRVEQVNALEDETRRLTDAELRAKTESFRSQVADGKSIHSLLPEVMAVGREVMDRAVGIRNIFNPEYKFDPAKLPSELQSTYQQLKAKADALEPQPLQGGEPAPGWMQIEIPNAIYEAVRKMQPESRPPFRCRPFDVQIIGGMVLGEGRIAEMRTGEGKTIVAPLACYVACCENLQCHIVTVNDYLVQRDRDWVFPFYHWLGLSVGAIHPFHMQPAQLKQQAYYCDAVYGTNSEFGFDYLRDNMKLSTAEQVQKHRDFCIIDEVDSILIDEARTPLIISGPAHQDAPKYDLADKIARHLVSRQREWNAADLKLQQAKLQVSALEGDIRNARDKSRIPAMRQQMKSIEDQIPQLESERDQHTQYYEVEMDKKATHLTHEGVAEAQKQAGVGSFYVGNNMDMPHLLENALRSHVVYQRDKDYVVREGEVIIVDEFTGRLMIGRQWSDGLHQAVEAKEAVKIKQETQTLATVTIQNFFKLYKRLAGMTGTAITEGTEFNEIYKLDVVCIPTNVPIRRIDRDDLIFLSEKDKWNAILDEIKRVHDLGRPVLVGTTSVEKSEMLSKMLTHKHGIQHQVLNAKVDQAANEAHIVEHAGELGAVMIATNMAGRGTDIKLRPVQREALIQHWKQRNLLPRQAEPTMTDEQLIELSFRHQAVRELGMKAKDADNADYQQLKMSLLRKWATEDAYQSEAKAAKMDEPTLLSVLDKLPDYDKHRVAVWSHVQDMGGLHIVGTERHEARRIDNQLRGRAGRQGDQVSSRFFISLEDDLMKLFAGKTTMAALSKLGMKEGDAIEHRWITRSVERAQRKVEERNYEIRKNLLEYDEVMEHQRNNFYSIRQSVLEGRDVDQIIFDYISESVDSAVGTYLADDYVPLQVAEWSRQHLDVSIEAGKIRLDNLDDLQVIVRRAAESETRQVIDVTLGEYMSNDIPPQDWDLTGLSQWAMTRFSVNLSKNKLRDMTVEQVRSELTESALRNLENRDLSGLAAYLEPHLGAKELANWCEQKFSFRPDINEIVKLGSEKAADHIIDKAREAYQEREIRYPVQFILELVFQGAQQDQNWAADQLVTWANQRYQMDWSAESVKRMTGQQIHDTLVAQARAYLRDGKLEQSIQDALQKHGDNADQLLDWMRHRYGLPQDETLPEDQSEWEPYMTRKARAALRVELTQLERFVLLQILDQMWKDHLYAMDQIKDSISLRGYAEKDPRIEYKREGAEQFRQMRQAVRERVTELIFRAKLTPNVQLRSAYGDGGAQQARHDAAPGTGTGGAAAMAAAQQGTAEQRADIEAAEHATRGGEGSSAKGSRKQRRAAAARERHGDTGKKFKQRKRR